MKQKALKQLDEICQKVVQAYGTMNTMDYVYQGTPFVDGAESGGGGGIAGKQSHISIAICMGIS